MILSEKQNKISRCSLVLRVTRDVQVMSHIPWEFRDSSLLKKSHSLLLVSEILLYPDACITSLWKVHEVRGSSKRSESKSQERVQPSLVLSPHSLSLPGWQCLTAALLTNISLQGHSRTAPLIWCDIFSRPSLILGRGLLHLLSGGSTQNI